MCFSYLILTKDIYSATQIITFPSLLLFLKFESRSKYTSYSIKLSNMIFFSFPSLTDAADPPCIVRVNIFVRSISRIDDVTMVSDCNLLSK